MRRIENQRTKPSIVGTLWHTQMHNVLLYIISNTFSAMMPLLTVGASWMSSRKQEENKIYYFDINARIGAAVTQVIANSSTSYATWLSRKRYQHAGYKYMIDSCEIGCFRSKIHFIIYGLWIYSSVYFYIKVTVENLHSFRYAFPSCCQCVCMHACECLLLF